ncbi:MAG: hypothetical protein ACT4O9_09745 [Blastocatellia bacterium]
MRKLSVIFILVFTMSAGVLAQNVPVGFDLSNYGVRIEPDKRVMVVLAAIESARTASAVGETVPVLNTPLSGQGAKFRELLKSDLAAMNDDLRQKIAAFLIQHKRRNSKATDAEIIAPFICMAKTQSPVPQQADPGVKSELPGNELFVGDFAPLVRDFYRRTSIGGNLGEYVKTYQTVSDGQLRNSAREMVNELLTYLQTRPQLYFAERIKTETQKGKSKTTTLKNVVTRERERKFFIVPEMLAPAGNVIFLNIKDDYYAVLPPDSDLSFSEVRRAYLQFVIDPLVLNNSKDVSTIRESVKQILEERRKVNPDISPDVFLTISRSLVAAIDSKQIEKAKSQIATAQARQRLVQLKTDEEKRAVTKELKSTIQGFSDETALRLSEDYEKGSILVFYFAEQLKGVEDSGFDIESSFREMILSFDPAKETNRLDQFAEARKRGLAAREERKKNPGTNIIVENPVTTRLLEIQKVIDEKNYIRADTELRQLLDKNPAEPRIFYNIGRVASLDASTLTNPADGEKQKAKLLEAKVAFENVLRMAQKQEVDPALKSLSYVSLAKIYEFYDNKTYAMAIYDAAIKIGPVTGGAYDEAMAAKQRLLKDQ